MDDKLAPKSCTSISAVHGSRWGGSKPSFPQRTRPTVLFSTSSWEDRQFYPGRILVHSLALSPSVRDREERKRGRRGRRRQALPGNGKAVPLPGPPLPPSPLPCVTSQPSCHSLSLLHQALFPSSDFQETPPLTAMILMLCVCVCVGVC